MIVASAKTARRFRPPLVPTLAAIVVIVIGIAAGNWQHRRMEQKQALAAELDAAAKAPPLALDALRTDTDWSTLRYRPVLARGVYIADRQILVDNKVVGGRAGYDVVTPLALDDGRLVLVVRGWVAMPSSRATLPAAPPPPGIADVRGRLAVPSSRYVELEPDATEGAVRQHLDPARYAAATGLRVLPVVIEQTEAPAADGLVRAWPAPELGVDIHRIYMVQWYAFAALTLVLWLWLNRPRADRGDG